MASYSNTNVHQVQRSGAFQHAEKSNRTTKTSILGSIVTSKPVNDYDAIETLNHIWDKARNISETFQRQGNGAVEGTHQLLRKREPKCIEKERQKHKSTLGRNVVSEP